MPAVRVPSRGGRCRSRSGLREALAWGLIVSLAAMASAASAQAPDVIARVKGSVVAVGSVQRPPSPQFRFLGTGFVVGDGTLVATNAHVVRSALAAGADSGGLAVAIPGGDPQTAQIRLVHLVAEDTDRDLALLRLPGVPLPALRLRDSDTVREGDEYLLTGFPIGSVLGLFAATHRAMIAAVSPIVIPPANAGKLDATLIRRLKQGAFPVFQLDATTHPGNSGSPLYDPSTGEVVAIMNMALVQGAKETALNNPSGISYAIPSTHLQRLIDRAR